MVKVEKAAGTASLSDTKRMPTLKGHYSRRILVEDGTRKGEGSFVYICRLREIELVVMSAGRDARGREQAGIGPHRPGNIMI